MFNFNASILLLSLEVACYQRCLASALLIENTCMLGRACMCMGEGGSEEKLSAKTELGQRLLRVYL